MNKKASVLVVPQDPHPFGLQPPRMGLQLDFTTVADGLDMQPFHLLARKRLTHSAPILISSRSRSPRSDSSPLALLDCD